MKAYRYMKLLVFCLLCGNGSLLFADFEKDISFYLPFDGNLTPIIAKGSQEFVSGFPYEFAEGKKGKALLIGKKGMSLKYFMENNLDPKEGTLSFWFKALDWNPGEIQTNGQKQEFAHVFFNFGTQYPNYQTILVYKYTNDELIFYCKKQEGAQNPATAKTGGCHAAVKGWKMGEWHHVACTWNNGRVAIFVDGKPGSSAEEVPFIPFPLTKKDMFNIGSSGWSLGDHADTLIDEFMIFKRALSEREIKSLYETASSSVSVSTYALPMTSVPPVIDGVMSANEWKSAAAMTGFMTIVLNTYNTHGPIVYLTYDQTNLYMAAVCQLPEGKTIIANAAKRDGEVWLDDSLELFLDPGRSGDKKKIFHFIGNTIGTVYDALGDDAKWNGHLNYKTTLKGREWTVELSIPWADLGVAMPAQGETWGFNVGYNLRYQGGELEKTKLICLSRVGYQNTDYNQPPFFDRIAFSGNTVAVQLLGLGDLDAGQVGIKAKLINPTGEEKEVYLQSLVHSRNLVLPALENGYINFDGPVLEDKQNIRLKPFQEQDVNIEKTFTDESFDVLDLIVNDGRGSVYLRTQTPFAPALGISMKIKPYPMATAMNVDVDISSLGAKIPEMQTCIISVNDKKGQCVFQAPAEMTTGTLYRATIPLSKIPAGVYDFSATVSGKDHKVLSSRVVEYEVYPMEEYNAFKGYRDKNVSGKVPPPWTPMETKLKKSLWLREIQAAAIECWDRSYEYKDGIFPNQITSRNITLLAAPIQITGIINGQPIRVNNVGLKFGKTSPDRIEGEASGSIGMATVCNSFWTEFDGFNWNELSLKAVKPVTIEKLALEIPVDNRVAEFLHLTRGYGEKWIKLSQEPIATAYVPVTYIFNDDVGLCFFAEGTENWSNADPNKQIQVIRTKDATKLVVNFIDSPVKVGSDLHLAFGLLASPVKPLAKGWQMLNFCNTPPLQPIKSCRNHFFHPNTCLKDNGKRDWGPFMDRDNFDGKKMVATYKLHQKIDGESTPSGISFIWGLLHNISVDERHCQYYRYEWMVEPEGYCSESTGPLLAVCTQSSFADAWLYYYANVASNYPFVNVYFDVGDLGRGVGCKNRHHGCGFVDRQGQIQRTFPIRAERAFKKKLYWIHYLAKGQPGYISSLANDMLYLPVMTFDSQWVLGEEYHPECWPSEDYTEAFPSVDLYRAKFNALASGVSPLLLPEYKIRTAEYTVYSWYGQEVKAGRKFLDIPDANRDTLLIYTLIHGTPLWHGCSEVIPTHMLKAYQAFEKFGVEDADFLPYWKNGNIITCNNSNVLASIYSKPRAALIIASNFSSAPAEAAFVIDFSKLKLGGKNLSIKECESGSDLPLTGNKITIKIPAKTFRVIEVSEK